MLTYGDGVADIDVEKLVAFHKKHGKIATLTAVRPSARFGSILMEDDGHINEFKEKPQTGKIVAISAGRFTDDGQQVPLTVKEGQTVLFDKYAGSEVKYEGASYLVLHEKDIMAIVD